MKNTIKLILIGLIILNPYTIYGNLAYIIMPPLVLFFLIYKNLKINRVLIICALLMICISLVGAISSHFNEIFQLEHFKVSLSILFYLLIGTCFYFWFEEKGQSLNDFLYLSLITVVINSAVILAEVALPSLRSIIESILAPSGNIDWKSGFRYRGIASGGGASLSFLVALSFGVCIYLFTNKAIKLSTMIVLNSILILSMFFIGRTGLLLLPIILLYFLIINFNQNKIKVIFSAFFVLLLSPIVLELIKNYLIGIYGVGFYKYVLGMFLDGAAGFEEEGTLSMLYDFMTVFPLEFPQVLFGYGFYGASDFYPWTDSGYTRTILSVGYIFGITYYALFFIMSINAFKYQKALFGLFFILMLIVEIKEPLMFSGYTSRLYFMILSFAMLESTCKSKKIGMNSKLGETFG